MKRILGRTIAIIGFIVALTNILQVMALPVGFVPITPENAADIRPLGSFRGTPYPMSNHADGRFLVTRSQGFLNITNLTSGKQVLWSPERMLAISPDQSTLLLSDQNETRLYNPDTGESHTLLPIGSNWGAFSPNGMWLMTSSGEDGLIRYWNATTREPIFFNSHQPKIFNESPIFSPDGCCIVMIGNGLRISLVDILKEEVQTQLPGQVDFGALFTPDGKTVITHGSHSFSLWDIKTDRQLSSIEVEDIVDLTASAVSPDSQTLIFQYHNSKKLTLWDISDPTHPELKADLGQQSNYALSPDGLTIALMNNRDAAVRLVDAKTGFEKDILENQPGRVTKITFSRDNHLLITSGYDEILRFWSWNGKNATLLTTVAGQNFYISSDLTTVVAQIDNTTMIYGIPTKSRQPSPLLIPGEIIPEMVNVRAEPNVGAPIVGLVGGKVLVAARNDQGNYVYLPDYAGWIRADEPYFRLTHQFSLDALPVMEAPQAVAALFTPTPPPTLIPESSPAPTLIPDPSILPAVNTPSAPLPPPVADLLQITLANLDQVRLLGVIPAEIATPRNNINLTADGRYVIANSNDKNLKIWESNLELWDLATLKTHPDNGLVIRRQLLISGAGNTYTFSSFSREIHIWRFADFKEMLILPLPSEESGNVQLSISPDETMLVIYNDWTETQLWDITTGELRAVFPATSVPPVFSPNSRLLAIAPLYGNVIHVYDIQTKAKQVSFAPLRRFSADIMTFTPDDSILMFSNMIWNINTGSLIADLGEQYRGLVTSPNGQFMAALSEDKEETNAYLWETSTGALVAVLPIESGSRNRLGFSADSRLLVMSNPFQVIDLASWTLHDIEDDYTGNKVFFTSDGTRILLGDSLSTKVFGIPGEAQQ